MGQLEGLWNDLTTKTSNYTMDLPDGLYMVRNQRFDVPLFCGTGTDDLGDHWAWCVSQYDYANEGKELIRLEREPDGTFMIYNRKYQTRMFCGDGTDDGGDHWAWFMKPERWESRDLERWNIEQQDDGSYKIFNIEYGGPLFCGEGTDDNDDHWVWVAPDYDYENDGKERWFFERIDCIYGFEVLDADGF